MALKGYVILSGPPASGKSTLGPSLAEELGIPYLAKDTIKQALIGELGAVDVEASRKLGAAAMRAVIALATETGSGVLDGTWLRDRSPALVAQLPGPVVEVFCRCPQQVMEQRYAARSSERSTGHFDTDRTWAELWGDQTREPVAGGWQVLEVATHQAVDVRMLAVAVREALSRPT